jgi:hypothetical protein
MTTDRPESGPSRVALGGFSAESKKIIRQLEDYGWTFRISKQGHAIGHAPDGETRTSISKNLSRANRSQQAAEATVKRWERHLEVQRLGAAVDALAADPEAGFDPVIDGVIAAGVQKRVAALAESDDLPGEHLRVTGEPELPETDVVAVRHVASRRPWLARQGSHRKKGTTSLYESGAVVEVTFTDGSKAYECSVESCDYTSDNPRSVSSHFRGHVRAGEAEPVGHLARPSVVKDVPVEDFRETFPGKSYTPSDRLLNALAEWLTEQSWDSTDALALLALTWFHERPDLADVEARTAEPLTDGQILAKIRLLVGGRDPETEEALRVALEANAAMQSKVDALQATSATLAEQVQSLTDALTEERSKSASLQADVDAWLALAPRPS